MFNRDHRVLRNCFSSVVISVIHCSRFGAGLGSDAATIVSLSCFVSVSTGLLELDSSLSTISSLGSTGWVWIGWFICSRWVNLLLPKILMKQVRSLILKMLILMVQGLKVQRKLIQSLFSTTWKVTVHQGLFLLLRQGLKKENVMAKICKVYRTVHFSCIYEGLRQR